MAVAPNLVGTFLQAAREIAPRVAAAADYNDRERELLPELAAEIADKGFFRMLVPRTLGGAEIDYLEHLSVIETLAEFDASTAWCVNQNAIHAVLSAKMPESTAREIWSDKRAVVANGPPLSAEAVPVDGGYRLNGRWSFSTGFRHATWVSALTPVRNPESGEEPSWARDDMLTLLVPKDDVTQIDAWKVNGMRGTGTYGFEIKDVFVPQDRAYKQSEGPRESGPLYVIPLTLMFAGGFASGALGVARGALKAAIEVAGGKTPRSEANLLRDRSSVQQQIGRAEANWSSARAFLREAAAQAWEGACEAGSLTMEQRIRLRLASTHTIRMAAEVVDVAYDICGTSAIFAGNPVQRRFQDMHVITQHLQGRMAHYETAGQFFLGLEPLGSF